MIALNNYYIQLYYVLNILVFSITKITILVLLQFKLCQTQDVHVRFHHMHPECGIVCAVL